MSIEFIDIEHSRVFSCSIRNIFNLEKTRIRTNYSAHVGRCCLRSIVYSTSFSSSIWLL